MSRIPVALLILRLLRIGVVFCAVSAALILAIVLWKETLSRTDHEMSMADYAFVAVVAGVIAAAVALSISISREIAKVKRLPPDDPG